MSYCGVYSHGKITEPPEVEIPESVSKEDCRRMVRQQVFQTPDSENHHVQLDAVNVFHSEDVGTITANAARVSCQGQPHKMGGHIVPCIVKVSQFRVILKEEELLAKGLRVEVVNDQARLPPGCNLQNGGCLLEQKTVVWNPPMTKCNLEMGSNGRNDSRRRVYD